MDDAHDDGLAAPSAPTRPEVLRVDRSRTPLRGEDGLPWLERVLRAAEAPSDGGGALPVRGRETRRVPFPTRGPASLRR